eukprot:15693694-Heterocapsa_arctica.AAC.1
MEHLTAVEPGPRGKAPGEPDDPKQHHSPHAGPRGSYEATRDRGRDAAEGGDQVCTSQPRVGPRVKHASEPGTPLPADI